MQQPGHPQHGEAPWPLLLDATTVRFLQADPMWAQVRNRPLIMNPKLRLQDLAFSTLSMLAAGQLEMWEAYLERLIKLINPDQGLTGASEESDNP